MVERTAGMLTGAAMSSVKTLVDLQNDVAVPAGVRRRSARDVLEMGLKYRETENSMPGFTSRPERSLRTLHGRSENEIAS